VPLFIGSYCAYGSTVYYNSTGTLYSIPAAGGTPTSIATDAGSTYCTATATQLYYSNPQGLWVVNLVAGAPTAPVLLVPKVRSGTFPMGGVAVDGDELFFATPVAGGVTTKVQVWRGSATDKDLFPTGLISGGDRTGDLVVDVAVDATNVYVATGGDVNSIYRIPRAGGPATRMTITSNEILSMVVTANDVVFTRDSIGVQSVPKTNDSTGAETDLWTPGVRLSYVTTTGGKLYVSPNCGLYEVTRN
jgi:hypothetical protein